MQNATERRQEILYFISDRRRVTYQQIADEFNISYKTAQRDVEILICSHPIITENWRGGGICAMDGWYATNRFLRSDEEKALEDVLNGLQPDLNAIRRVLTAFAKPKVKEDKH